MKRAAVLAALLALGGCVTAAPPPPAPLAAGPVEVQILAINDFHGHLEPPKIAVDAVLPNGAAARIPAGGVAHLAAAAQALRRDRKHSVTVSAGDLIGASPLISALFLDEPTIRAMDQVGLDYNAVGNHEFDRGTDELLRMQNGGCGKFTTRTPCAVEPFTGAAFKFLAANVLTADGRTLFPATAIKDFGPVQVALIGMTLEETATLVTPAGVAGLTFADEAATANALVPQLKQAGADAIVLLIHQGGSAGTGPGAKSCRGFDGDILPIIEKLDPAIDLVVSGHSHAAYVCEFQRPGRARPLLLTSAGRYGTLVSDIRLTIDPAAGVVAHRADNVIVQGQGFRAGSAETRTNPAFPVFPADPVAAASVARYAAASAAAASRIVGRLDGPATRDAGEDREQSVGYLVADAQLAAARAAGAEVAFINAGGVRADIIPAADGTVTYGQIFAVQPFGNNVVVKTLTGAQLNTMLEAQFVNVTSANDRANMLFPSRGFFFAYDLGRAPGDRIVDMRLDGKAIDAAARYRVAVNNFIASGGDNFTVLTEAGEAVDVGLDLDALEAWLKRGAKVPELGRIEDRTAGR